MRKKDLENLIMNHILNGEARVMFKFLMEKETISIIKRYNDYFRKYFLYNSENAYYYAKYVDKGPREETRDAAKKDKNIFRELYLAFVDRNLEAITFSRLLSLSEIDAIYSYRFLANNGCSLKKQWLNS